MASDRIPETVAQAQRMIVDGDPAVAAAAFRRLIAATPADVEARYGLASALAAASDGAGAGVALEEARTLDGLLLAGRMGADVPRLSSDSDYAAQIATQLYSHHHVATASVVFGRAIAGGHVSQQGIVSYGLSLQHQGRTEEAIRVFRVAAELYPSAGAHQFLIYPPLFCADGEARQSAAAKEWAKLYARGAPAAPHRNPPLAGRRLRIGYVAPWFARNQLKQFITPLLENHDPETVSVCLYPTEAQSEADWPSWIEVHPIGRLDDAGAAALIRSHGIDVLADCWGHTAGSRLPMFAHRPAPVQIGWLNFIQTTGLDQIDYVLHADGTEAIPGIAELFTEQIWPIGPVFTAFRPAAGRLPPVPTPVLKTGQVTFGSFNHPAKLGDAAFDAWAGILRGVAGSRLLLKYSYFVDPVLQRVTRARFAARGVAPERILFAGHSSGEAYFRSFQDVDLMLDAWPAPGSTTTLEALSNGVPVLVNETPGTGGLYVRSVLEACGLAELIAKGAEDFVVRAVDLASDPGRLDAVRARVRPGFDSGLLCDEVGFTRRVEAAFEEMFDLWLARSRGGRAHG